MLDAFRVNRKITRTAAVINSIINEISMLWPIPPKTPSNICFTIFLIAEPHPEKFKKFPATSLPILFVSEPSICVIPAGKTMKTEITPSNIDEEYAKSNFHFF